MSTPASAPPLRVGVEPAGAGQRLDRWLVSYLPDRSRTEVQRWIKSGEVMVNGTPARAGRVLAAGDVVEVWLPVPVATPGLVAEPLPLSILYEDADILVVDKPAGMVVHPAPGHQSGTLVNAVLHHCPDLLEVGGERRPGIVHRLDKDTSGVMVIAKHDRALRDLQAQFKARRVYKEYQALVEGRPAPPAGRIQTRIGRHPVDRKRQAVIEDRSAVAGREAVTEYSVEAVYTVRLRSDQGIGHFSWLRAHPITGRTHQLRVHLAWRGHPIVGDPIYGPAHPRLHVPRLCLHAARLRLRVPGRGEVVEFVAPVPPDLQAVLAQLEQAAL